MSIHRAKELIRDNLNIPTMPEVIGKIQAMLNDPDSGTKEMGELISQDAPLSAKVLRIANSAYYGLRQPCVSTEQASAILGMRVLRNVVTQAAVIEQFQHLSKFATFDLDEAWRHSIATAQVCSRLAQQCRTALDLNPDEFYVCGLLHDLGQIVLLDSLGKHYVRIIDESKSSGTPIHVAERDYLDFDHTDVGAMVATRWGLPEPVIAAIQYHHGPREAVENDPVVSLVANANLLVNRVAASGADDAALVFDQGTCVQLGLGRDQMGDAIEFAQTALESAEV